MTDGKAPARGWTSRDLAIIPAQDESYWSTADAALLLGTTASQIRALIRLADLHPAGKRRGTARQGGRYVRVYAATELARVYDAVTDLSPGSP